MQTIRKLILFGCAAAMISMLVNTGGPAKATTQPQLEKFGTTAEGSTRTPAAQLQVYLDNKASIDAVLLSLGEKATLCDAIQAWTESGSPVDVSEGHPVSKQLKPKLSIEQLQKYVDHQEAIDVIWIGLQNEIDADPSRVGEEATLYDAIHAWSKSHPDDNAEADASKPINEKFVNYSPADPAEQPAEVSSRVVYASSCGSAASYSGDKKFGWRVRRAGGFVARGVGWLFGRRR